MSCDQNELLKRFIGGRTAWFELAENARFSNIETFSAVPDQETDEEPFEVRLVALEPAAPGRAESPPLVLVQSLVAQMLEADQAALYQWMHEALNCRIYK